MIIAKEIKGKLGSYKIIEKNNCVRYLINEIENLTFDYVNKFQVIERKFQKKSLSGKYGNMDYGFFVVKGNDKLTVYNKFLDRGIIYNSTIVKKIITFIIVRPRKIETSLHSSTSREREEKEEEEEEEIPDKGELFKDIHKEIEKEKKTLSLNSAKEENQN
jgi:hypothetical protein